MYKRQIQSRIARLHAIETMSQDGTFAVLPKTEVIQLKKEWETVSYTHLDVYKRQVPIESVVVKFPRMIRDLSKKLDKKMELYMSGDVYKRQM